MSFWRGGPMEQLVAKFFRGDAKHQWTGVVRSKEDERGWYLVQVYSEHDHGATFMRLVSRHDMSAWTFYDTMEHMVADKARAEREWHQALPNQIEEFLMDIEANLTENELIGEDLVKAWHKWRVGREQASL